MCSVVILRRPGHPWPIVMGANRDEMRDRPWAPPARHWPDRPEVRAGLDELAGGTWMGLNDTGLAAAVLNRVNTLGPAPGKRSRGELVLDALDHADAVAAAEALSELDPRAWRPFNLIVADDRHYQAQETWGGEIAREPHRGAVPRSHRRHWIHPHAPRPSHIGIRKPRDDLQIAQRRSPERRHQLSNGSRQKRQHPGTDLRGRHRAGRPA